MTALYCCSSEGLTPCGNGPLPGKTHVPPPKRFIVRLQLQLDARDSSLDRRGALLEQLLLASVP
jgi:hypothetical protein